MDSDLADGCGVLCGSRRDEMGDTSPDTLGEYAPPMAQYVFHPTVLETFAAFAATAATATGWWLAARRYST